MGGTAAGLGVRSGPQSGPGPQRRRLRGFLAAAVATGLSTHGQCGAGASRVAGPEGGRHHRLHTWWLPGRAARAACSGHAKREPLGSGLKPRRATRDCNRDVAVRSPRCRRRGDQAAAPDADWPRPATRSSRDGLPAPARLPCHGPCHAAWHQKARRGRGTKESVAVDTALTSAGPQGSACVALPGIPVGAACSDSQCNASLRSVK